MIPQPERRTVDSDTAGQPTSGSQQRSTLTTADVAAPWTGNPSIYRALRANLNRLTAEVIDAVEDGTWAVPEASRLHAWIKSELVLWSQSREAEVATDDRAELASVVSDRSLLIGLNSLLSGSRGAEAAQWASEIKSVGLSLISRIEMLQTSRP